MWFLRLIWFVLTNPSWDICHFFSPDWVMGFADKTRHPFWTDYGIKTLSGLTVTLIAGGYVELRMWWWRKTGIRIGANWQVAKQSKNGTQVLCISPKVNVVSRAQGRWGTTKIVHSIWVRERADIADPGQIYGKVDLTDTAVHQRTTGGDPLNLTGAAMLCPPGDAETIMKCPIFVQWTDGTFSKAMSMGNEPSVWEKIYMKWKIRK